MKKKKVLSVLLTVLLACQCFIFLSSAEAKGTTKTKEEILKNMSTEDKISQMLMPAFRWYDDENVIELNEKIEQIIEKRPFAGVILFAQNNSSTQQTTQLIDSIQKANIKEEKRPQLLIAVDQEGAGVSRLAEGTQGPGNMALGATYDSQNAYDIGKIIGRELNVMGYNVDFAPVVDVNSNPSNPIIGVRSFSDSADIVAEFGTKFMKGLKSSGIITSLKHFPGHGDTETDSHTGLPRIEKTYEELKKNELISFKKCIENGAEMVMTAHIQYPKIEKGTYTSIEDGSLIELPATLSKNIITDILRNDLGFKGVVVTDAMDMGAISLHFNKLDSAKLAINAGDDIILMPVETKTEEGTDELDQYISDVAKLVDEGEISEENVNNAVLRILTLKENNGLLEVYSNSDVQKKVENAKKIVGSKENHDKEWEIAKKSITLVKNDENMLPIKNNEKTDILVFYDNEVHSGEYAINKLKEDKKIPSDMDASVHLIDGKELSEIEEIVKNSKNVIVISEQYGSTKLSSESYSNLDNLADYVHSLGNKIAIISCNLPYEVARLNKADAILLAYSSKGMNELPNFEKGTGLSFGVSIPAGIYTAFDKEAKLGKLPVNIPKLDNEYAYTSEYLYEREFGLKYDIVGQNENLVIEDENKTSDSKITNPDEGENPKTGISIFVIVLISIISFVIAFCMVITIIYTKKRKEK